MNPEILKSLRHNLTVNLLDGAFFGFAAGFASFVTILPLFVSTMTDSPLLIGLIPAIHAAGWQLPQLFTAGWISRRERIKPLVLSLSTLERAPYFGMAAVAFLIPTIGVRAGLIATFVLLIIQGLGAGFTANPWQSMIGKIIPGERRGTFFGMQAGAANMLASIGAILAGLILGKLTGYTGFGWCFVIASFLLVISWFFMAMTREPSYLRPRLEGMPITPRWNDNLERILRHNSNFRWFLFGRMASQLATIGYAFYTVYAVQHHGVSKIEIGLMTGVMMGTQIIANVMMGWLGDRVSHRLVMQFGLVAMTFSAMLAWWAPSPSWFYLVFILAAIGNVAIWTVGLSMTLEYGSEDERPAYIGMANTLVAPANILAPFLGGWLAASYGYPAAFAASALGALLAAGIFAFMVQDQKVVNSTFEVFE